MGNPLDSFRLTEAQEQLLRKTPVGLDGPGTILRDFETLLNFIEETTPTLTTRNLLLPMRVLESLNVQMTYPLRHGLARPQQKTFAHIHGLYLLARSSGLTRLEMVKNKPVLDILAETRATWNELNPVEQYFTLFEIWLLWADPALVGERAASGRFLSQWPRLFARLREVNPYTGENYLDRPMRAYLGEYNLALLELFGCVKIKHGEPEAGEGWQVEHIEATAWGEALLSLLVTRFPEFSGFDLFSELPDLLQMFREDVANDALSEVEVEEDADRESREEVAEAEGSGYGVLQPFFQPYFPQWQRNLTLPKAEFRDGIYLFHVALDRDLWRRIEIPATASLDELADAILAAYKFDNDHLYRFVYMTQYGWGEEINHPMLEEGVSTAEVRVGDFPLRLGQRMVFHYDFGDDWNFLLTLERIDPPNKRRTKWKIVERKGKAPEQYRDPDEDEEEWGDEAFWFLDDEDGRWVLGSRENSSGM